MNSYNKLAKLRDETKFELKTIKRWIDEDPKNRVRQFQEKQLEKLFKLYEIE